MPRSSLSHQARQRPLAREEVVGHARERPYRRWGWGKPHHERRVTVRHPRIVRSRTTANPQLSFLRSQLRLCGCRMKMERPRSPAPVFWGASRQWERRFGPARSRATLPLPSRAGPASLRPARVAPHGQRRTQTRRSLGQADPEPRPTSTAERDVVVAIDNAHVLALAGVPALAAVSGILTRATR